MKYEIMNNSKLSIGDYIYKRTFNKPSVPSNMIDLEWFSTISGYGSEASYGPIITTYRIKKVPQLLDMGKMHVRQNIIKTLKRSGIKNSDIIMDPDEQWSGGDANKRLHNVLKQVYNRAYDGTIIISDPVNETDHKDLEGVTEVVLWKNHSKILQKM